MSDLDPPLGSLAIPALVESAKDPREELADLARSARALVEWHELCGATGLVSDATPAEVLAFIDAPSPTAIAKARRIEPTDARVENRARPDERRPQEVAPAKGSQALAPGHVQAVASGARAHRPEGFTDAATPTLSADEKKQRLSIIEARAKSCTACVLCEKRKQAVFSRGDPSSEICFIGEGPGADEDAQGQPFVGKAGQLLDKMIAGMGLQRDEVYICNIVKCRPPENREPLPAEVAACSAFLSEQLEIVKPKVIVTLGNVPLKALFNVQGIMKLRGTWRLYKGSVPVMPTYHPAYVLRNPTVQVRGDVWNDLKLVMKQLGRPIPPPRKPQ